MPFVLGAPFMIVYEVGGVRDSGSSLRQSLFNSCARSGQQLLSGGIPAGIRAHAPHRDPGVSESPAFIRSLEAQPKPERGAFVDLKF
jgi:hypothetical protein